MATIREAAVDLMVQMCNDERFGYYIGGRPQGDYNTANPDTFTVLGVNLQVPVADYDCGSSIRKVYRLLGVNIGSASSTNNMKEQMCDVAQTFIAHPWTDSYTMRPGDIALYVNPGYNGSSAFGHAAMCIDSNFTLAEFYPGNGLQDAYAGDQGGEGRIVPYYNYTGSSSWESGWTYCLELKDEIGNQAWGGTTTGGTTAPSGMQDPNASNWADLVSNAADISNMQGLLNTRLAAFGISGVTVTGTYDTQTQRGLIRLLQASHNVDFAAGLSITGYINAATASSMSAHPVGQGGETYGNDAWVVKAALLGNGWVLDLSHWNIDSKALTALAGHKSYYPTVNNVPVCDGPTLRTLAPAVSV